MKAVMILCDHAAVADSKLYISGGGWNSTLGGVEAVPSGLALLIDVPWDMTNTDLDIRVTLLTEDGQGVVVEGPAGPQPVAMGGIAQVGRPAGHPLGTPVTLPMAMNMGPLPLPSGVRFTWELTINGEHREDWRVSFGTR